MTSHTPPFGWNTGTVPDKECHSAVGIRFATFAQAIQPARLLVMVGLV